QRVLWVRPARERSTCRGATSPHFPLRWFMAGYRKKGRLRKRGRNLSRSTRQFPSYAQERILEDHALRQWSCSCMNWQVALFEKNAPNLGRLSKRRPPGLMADHTFVYDGPVPVIKKLPIRREITSSPSKFSSQDVADMLLA